MTSKIWRAVWQFLLCTDLISRTDKELQLGRSSTLD